VVASDFLAMGLSSNVIVLIELAHADQVPKIPIPRKPSEFSLYKLFMDPSGRHLIITSLEGENWYLFRGWRKPKQLKTFKMVIESVAWNKAALLSSSHSTSTREILVGARNGTIYEAILDAEEDFFKSQERYLNAVFTLPERQPITGLNFDFFPSVDPKKVLIVAITASRIYQFSGTLPRRPEEGGRLFGMIFAAYREAAPSVSVCFAHSYQLTVRRNIRTPWQHSTFGVALLHSQQHAVSIVTKRNRLDDKSVYIRMIGLRLCS
jgi:vacuolar protein sorting-associated protein 18